MIITMFSLWLALAVGFSVAMAAAYLGSFMVIKRMSLVGDALSHVALPGMAIALTLNLSPMLGAFVALTMAIIGIWYMEKKSKLYPEALVGVFFTFSLAIGILITPEPELLEALFGSIEKLTIWESLVAIAISIAMTGLIALISNQLVICSISEEIAKSMKIKIDLINLVYLLLVGLVVALGVKLVGTLLMGALVIVPAVAAKNISRNLKSYFSWSMVFGISASLMGVLLSFQTGLPTGPLVVLGSVIIFIVTYFFKVSV